MDKGGQVCNQMDSPLLSWIPAECGSAPTICIGLQPCQFHADVGITGRDQALVIDDPA